MTKTELLAKIEDALMYYEEQMNESEHCAQVCYEDNDEESAVMYEDDANMWAQMYNQELEKYIRLKEMLKEQHDEGGIRND